jgi:hypothetical protein
MSQVDQFESVFRSAVKDVFLYTPVTLQKILIVTDLPGEQVASFVEKVKLFTHVLGADESIQWQIVTGEQFNTTEDVLNLVNNSACELVCTYRNLKSKAWQFPHSLGAHLDVLLQKTSVPVLVLPHPEAGYAFEHALENINNVMALTDHLSNDHNLVNYSVRFTQAHGNLFLVHIEDQVTFDRYLETISKIPTIDTDDAREKLQEQLLKMPKDYIRSCRDVLAKAQVSLEVIEKVVFGHHLSQCRHYIEDEKVDLLVMHTKDDEQLAMHGLAYPLAVEIRQIPLLML